MWRKFIIAAAACLLFAGGLFADEARVAAVNPREQTITVNVDGKEQTLDARRIKLFNAAGRESKLEDLKLEKGDRLEYKARDGKITELKVPGGKY